ncbi:MAG TPA: hypothetical protein VKA53_08125 [Thermoanaerobaculia bacterium]|nr:hypothetical protein [Thermoanaerobaculia bacterium]
MPARQIAEASVGVDADDVTAAPDLAVDPLQRLVEGSFGHCGAGKR